MIVNRPPTNAQLKAWRTLGTRAGRDVHGLFIAEGEHMAQEALRENCAQALLCDESLQQRFAPYLEGALPAYVLKSHVFAALCDAKTPQGIAALCPMPQNAALPQLGGRIVALNALQDPGNVGAILRTMDAAGFTGLLIDDKTADPFGPKALRASMGAALRIPVCRCHSLPDELKALAGFAILAGDLHGQPFFERPDAPDTLCLLIGNEGAGLDEAVLACATLRLKLPMPGRAESLNAAVAAGIMIYDVVRRTS